VHRHRCLDGNAQFPRGRFPAGGNPRKSERVGQSANEFENVDRQRVAHSGDLERSIRSIMNTDPGDHEHADRVPCGAWRAAGAHGRSLPTDSCSLSPFLAGGQAFLASRRGDAVAFAQAGALQLDPVRAVNNAVENRIADRGIAHQFVPVSHGNLAGHQQRALLVTIVDDLEQIAPLLGSQRLRYPIVDDQQPLIPKLVGKPFRPEGKIVRFARLDGKRC
jgi:hypothetical protein